MKLHDEIGNRQENPLLIAKSLFENAEDYLTTSLIILRRDPSQGSVIFTNLAFSCELFLKSILFQFKNDNERVREHRLYELYKLIPVEQQAEIKVYYEKLPETKDNFYLLFQDVNETFVFARYIHERNGACFSYELFYLVYAVRNSAKKLYNKQIMEENRLELEKFEKYKSMGIERSLKVWIYYSENCNCNIDEVAKKIVGNLCDSLKADFDHYVLDKNDKNCVERATIMLIFTRLGYIYNDEYNNIIMTSLKIFKFFGISNPTFRTNGHHINLQKEKE